MANKIITSKTQLLASTGLDLGVSDWIAVEQSRIDMFAEATGDHQWIHVDPIKAAEGPFGACIAHGYLTLSLVNYFLPQLVDVQNISMGVNYGCDKVRFPNVVKAGSKVRGTGQIISVEEVKGSVQVITRVTIEVAEQQRPACVVDTISRYSFV
ncbi:MaoC family dehydratase [Pseudoalteromonas sp. HL-AS2]|uniref:MaoC family dehydratase n=1 Tax=unclassified Pseudoalteromonas TaxID=194690 RepID=UPI0018CF0263|nr:MULTISPECIES: MaoC family dehydratase [unclassified Pseudoalteromonas]MBH0093058.1 MaoC family dehydratase [Pseudoalteromonas sp. SCQQ13]MBO7925541.1 MaoC family dehydratase [Pseudoalteromonas sp. K222D]WMS93683.1 MaoC family dehydratase [Pseudoalteromonas sp. HL-AS2]